MQIECLKLIAFPQLLTSLPMTKMFDCRKQEHVIAR